MRCEHDLQHFIKQTKEIGDRELYYILTLMILNISMMDLDISTEMCFCRRFPTACRGYRGLKAPVTVWAGMSLSSLSHIHSTIC